MQDRSRERKAAVLLTAVSVAVVMVACDKGGTGGEKRFQLAFVAGAATDFWTYAEAGCKQADKELGDASVEFRFTSGASSAEQRRIIDDLLARGIDALAVTPLDPLNQGPLINSVAQQIPVVITDSDIPDSQRLCYVGTNNVDAGRAASGLVKEVLPDGGKIMLFVGKTDAQNAKERIRGLKEGLQGTQIEIIDIRTDDLDRVRAKANVNDTLVKYPDVSCLVGLWSYNAPAILNAVKEAGKLGEVKIVAFDEEDETLNGVKDGYIYGTVVQQPFEFGYRSIQLLARVLRSDRTAVPESRQIIIPTKIIKKDEAESFLRKIHALRDAQR